MVQLYGAEAGFHGSPAWAEVALSVYELHGTAAINLLTSAAGVGGVYHVGVEVYGLEWSFGGADLGTGVYMVHVGESTLGNFLERVPLGNTNKSPEQVFAILEEFRRTWRGTQYHLLAKNCAHFSVEFTRRLGFSNQPAWVNALADYGKGLTGAQARGSIQPVEEEGLDKFDDDELEEFAEDGDHIAILELVWRRAKEYTLEWAEQQRNNSKFEDLLIEVRLVVPPPDEDGKLHDTAVRLLRDSRLQRAIAEATATGLGLIWERADPKDEYAVDSCPLKIVKFTVLQNSRVSVTARVTGGPHMKRLRKKPTPLEFTANFKKYMNGSGSIIAWKQREKVIIDNMILDTTPGQPAMHKRVLTRSGAQGGAICFPRKDFKTPQTSLNAMLKKLQDLRFRVQEQSVTHRTLAVMMGPEASTPWWAT